MKQDCTMWTSSKEIHQQCNGTQVVTFLMMQCLGGNFNTMKTTSSTCGTCMKIQLEKDNCWRVDPMKEKGRTQVMKDQQSTLNVISNTTTWRRSDNH